MNTQRHNGVKAVVAVLISLLILQAVMGAIRTFTVQETDFVKLKPSAVDPDKDKILFNYTSPFNAKGEWQTTLDDAGVYDVNITASDGVHQQVERVRIIVNNKNQPPRVTEKKIVVRETETIDLKKVVVDPDDDGLRYVFSPPFDNSGVWKTDYTDEGTFVTTFTIDDGNATTEGRVEVTVLHGNRPPEIIDSFSESNVVKIAEDSMLSFFVSADDDEDLQYLWTLDGEKVSDEDSGVFYLDFNTAGRHILDVRISDGTKETKASWTVLVDNVNRKPTLSLLPLSVKEGQKAIISVPEKDVDGDVVRYSFESPFAANGEWQTTFDDAGKYKIDVTASDGEFTVEETVEVMVIDVDRAPIVDVPLTVTVKEQEQLQLKISSTDPDKDPVDVTVKNLPEGAVFHAKNSTIVWTPTYDAIRRSGKFWSNLLNRVRLERFILKSKPFPVTIESCGKKECTSTVVRFVVENVNRAPVLDQIGNITIKETETATVHPAAYDPDGDIIRYYFTSPAGRRDGVWRTDHDDEGKNTIYITATDGSASDTKPVLIDVKKTNRPPILEIADDDVVVNEGRQFLIRVGAKDPDMDLVKVRLENLPPGASFADGVFLWQPSFSVVQNATPSVLSGKGFLNKKLNKNDAVVWLQFVGSDGEAETAHPVKVTVKNVNQPPVITGASDVKTALVNQPMLFSVNALDADNDALTYTWSFGLGEGTAQGSPQLERTFVTPGEKAVRIVVSDGVDSIEREWRVVVNPVEEEFVQQVVEEPMAEEVPEEPFTIGVYVIKG